MQQGTYLSVDLDFWNNMFEAAHKQGSVFGIGEITVAQARDHLYEFMSTLKERVANLRVVDSHEELCWHANNTGRKFNCSELVNVDHHSDITDRYSYNGNIPLHNHFNCGTWINFVDFRKEGTYKWILPYDIKEASSRGGFCHGWGEHSDPFVYPDVSGWRKTTHCSTANPLKEIDWQRVVGAGIAFSYDWLCDYSPTMIRTAAKALGYKPKPNPNAKIE